MTVVAGQQIRSKIDSFQIWNANFLISQPNPMMLHLLESSRRDDFNQGHITEFGWEMRKKLWKPICSFFLTLALWMSNGLYPNEMQNYLPSHFDLSCLLILLCFGSGSEWQIGMNVGIQNCTLLNWRNVRTNRYPIDWCWKT